MDSQLDKIVQSFSRPLNQTERLLKLFHLNRFPDNVKQKESFACSKCLMPWENGNFDLRIKPSNAKRVARRNHRIVRIQEQIKSKKLDKSATKSLSRKLARLQKQNNHVALYKCLCNKTTSVQLRKTQRNNDKHSDKSDNVAAAIITSETTKQLVDTKKVKEKKKKKKTAGLIIPPKIDVASSSSSTHHRNHAKISQMLKQQKAFNNTQQQGARLNQFLK